MKKIISFIFALLVIPAYAMAEISVSLTLDRYEVSLVDSVKMIVSISGSRDSGEPQIAGLENFIVQNSGRSSRVQIINGRVSSNLDYNYFIQPKRLGTFDIGPASVKVDGKVFQSNTARIAVKNSVDQRGGAKDPVFLTAILSSKRVYLEEQILYTIRLYHIPEVSNISLTMPEADGTTFTQLGKPVEYNSKYNSKDYGVIEVRYSLMPSKAGHFEINPARMNMLVHGQQSRNDTDDFFSMDDFFANARGKPVTLAGNSLVLDVLEVPDKGKPADYTGLVGSFQISAELAPARIKAGESATLTVILTGTGNINRAPDLKIQDIENAKIYSDEPKLETRQTEKGLEGKKTMKWAIVPVKEGQYEIPSLSISYFDTTGRYYNRIKTRPFKLYADPGSGGMAESPFAAGQTLKPGKEAVEELGKDILPVHRTVGNLTKVSPGSIGMSWLFLFFPVLLYGLIIAGIRITRKSPRKEVQSKSLKAARVFYKICRDKDISANVLSGAIRNYINGRFALELGGLSPHEIENILKEKNCSEETIKQMEWMLKKIETLIYTGKSEEPCDLSEEAVIIVKSIEKEMK